MLTQREEWLKKELQNRKESLINRVKLEDEVLLFGEILSIDHPDALMLRKKLQKVPNGDKEKIQKAYDAFYKEMAKSYLTQRAEFFAQKMGLSYSELRFRKMKSRWGSCSSQKKITLNTALMKVDKALIDYVVVHELAHLVHMNHSKAFHALVAEYLSDAKARRSALKKISLQS
jgi:predicted metal-dependent hydrolase